MFWAFKVSVYWVGAYYWGSNNLIFFVLDNILPVSTLCLTLSASSSW